ncbi:lipopolysaccharide biosynthesis protein [Pseudomonas fragi]|uniref:Lipopolysaccharide biosynthesis protein wzxC n=1 Tax=Pseudomonas fragi TaxID=296 RepID=A0A449IKT4_PSEFR|nr:lipopolysaccharide biosynthesis protein [Pseudomonas fragi]VFB20066.1 Lipopolysaccharide biosynthesis protein wzxC [Pseudomonas fragi]
MNRSNSLYRSIGKSIVGRYAVYAVNLLSMMLLARIFTPQIFGTVASIGVFYLFFQVMSEAGLGPAIINIDKLDKENRNGLFGLTLTVGTLLGVLFFLSAPIFVIFYQQEDIGTVVPFVSVALFFFSAAIVPTAFLLRDQAFFRIANAGVLSEIISTLATIILFKFTEPLYALASKAIFSSATNFFVVYYFSDATEFGRPKWGSKFSAIKPLLSFSSYQFSFNFINYFARNLDNILVGKYMGVVSLGIYDKAYQLMRYPLMLLTFAMTPAIQPSIRKYAHDKDKVLAIHQDFTFKLSLVGAAAGLTIFLLSDWIVKIMLGSQWLSVIPIIKVLAISIPAQVVLSTSGSFFQAMNRSDLLLYSGLISTVILVLAISWGIYERNMISLSWALVIAFHINFIQAYYILHCKLLNKGLLSFFLRMVPAATTTLGMTLWYLV